MGDPYAGIEFLGDSDFLSSGDSSPPPPQGSSGDEQHSESPPEQQGDEKADAAKNKRGKKIDAHARELILFESTNNKLGPTRIAAKFKGRGVTANAAKSIAQRSKRAGPRKKPGKPFKVVTAESVAAGPDLLKENPSLSVRSASAETGLSKTSARRVIKEHLKKKSLTKIKVQRVQALPQKKRLAACAKWLAQMQENWEFDPRKVFRTDEKLFRIGEVSGGNNNFRIWVDEHTAKADLPPEVAQRGGGAHVGGARVMACFGVSWHGKGTVHVMGQKETLNTESYGRVLDAAYSADCQQIFKGEPFVFQQDGASCHNSKDTQERRGELFGEFIPKRTYSKATGEVAGWPPSSPDLNPPDYFAWGWAQNYVGQKKPSTLPALQVAIRQAADALPMDMVKKAIDGFYKRAWLVVKVEGKHFKHMLKKKFPDTPPAPGRESELVNLPVMGHEPQSESEASEDDE